MNALDLIVIAPELEAFQDIVQRIEEIGGHAEILLNRRRGNDAMLPPQRPRSVGGAIAASSISTSRCTSRAGFLSQPISVRNIAVDRA